MTIHPSFSVATVAKKRKASRHVSSWLAPDVCASSWSTMPSCSERLFCGRYLNSRQPLALLKLPRTLALSPGKSLSRMCLFHRSAMDRTRGSVFSSSCAWQYSKNCVASASSSVCVSDCSGVRDGSARAHAPLPAQGATSTFFASR